MDASRILLLLDLDLGLDIPDPLLLDPAVQQLVAVAPEAVRPAFSLDAVLHVRCERQLRLAHDVEGVVIFRVALEGRAAGVEVAEPLRLAHVMLQRQEDPTWRNHVRHHRQDEHVGQQQRLREATGLLVDLPARSAARQVATPGLPLKGGGVGDDPQRPGPRHAVVLEQLLAVGEVLDFLCPQLEEAVPQRPLISEAAPVLPPLLHQPLPPRRVAQDPHPTVHKDRQVVVRRADEVCLWADLQVLHGRDSHVGRDRVRVHIHNSLQALLQLERRQRRERLHHVEALPRFSAVGLRQLVPLSPPEDAERELPEPYVGLEAVQLCVLQPRHHPVPQPELVLLLLQHVGPGVGQGDDRQLWLRQHTCTRSHDFAQHGVVLQERVQRLFRVRRGIVACYPPLRVIRVQAPLLGRRVPILASRRRLPGGGRREVDLDHARGVHELQQPGRLWSLLAGSRPLRLPGELVVVVHPTRALVEDGLPTLGERLGVLRRRLGQRRARLADGGGLGLLGRGRVVRTRRRDVGDAKGRRDVGDAKGRRVALPLPR
mmetsp:Transcript_40800/g.107812  ORF Transcript_40800/g.107812 Transcript_40800/m.107812 type:complete len:543 (+) Transcript_40800:246-1874(+)